MPGTMLPLHIFEPRYRAMVADALEWDRLIGMLLLRPGWEGDYDGRPPVFPIGCAGVITHHERLPDGRYNIVLRGLEKFRIDEEDRAKAYRMAHIGPLLEGHPGESGLWLVTDNVQAFALRAAAARHAERSLDLQYYYWKDDMTGSLLAREVIGAADRGVRVRLLIDDINTRGGDRNYLALERHPNIEVRLFNPTRCRDNALLRGAELLLRFWSVNRRMHNKAWIVDNRLAIVGGRNIGNAYFDAARESNFRDMDVVSAGPVVAEASAVFDRYWNSDFVFPIRTIARPIKANLGRLRKRCETIACFDRARPYLRRVEQERTLLGLRTGDSRLHWTASAEIVSDPPEKAASRMAEDWLTEVILSVLTSSRKSIDLTSPYFIPRDAGLKRLVELAGRGVEISVLTNSLAATDVAAVHGAYMRFRKPLLGAGVRLFELKPGGAHLMLMELSRSLTKGERVPLTLKLESGAEVKTELGVAEMGARHPGHGR